MCLLPVASLSIECAEPTAHMQGLPRLRASQVPADQVIYVDLHGYIVAFREIRGDAGVAQRFRRHILQMDRTIDPPRLLSIHEFHPTSDQHPFKVQARTRNVDHHGGAWSLPEVPILVCVARGRNADVFVDPQEPHGQEMDTPVVVERGQVSDERHRKELVDLVGTEDWGLVCGGVGRAACHNIPPLVADLPNETKIKNGGIY
jgi:hypothetical protein